MTRTTAQPLRHADIGNGPPVVLLHPIAMRLEFWTPVAERLASTNRVISLDLRGHGENPHNSEPFSIEDLADDVIALIRAKDIGPSQFVGCSLGGMVSQAVALKAPELASALVLANTTHAMSDQSRAVMLARAEASEKGLDQTVDADIERWFPPAFRAANRATVEVVRGWVLANDKTVVANGWRAIAGLDFREAVGTIDCPVTVITGSLDPASPPQAAIAMSTCFLHGRYEELADTGHFSPLERPDAFAAAVRRVSRPGTNSN